MGADDGAVDEKLFEVRVLGQLGEHLMPHAFARPAGKALINAVPGAEFGGQVAPWAAGACDPQHRFDKQPVIGRGAARIAYLARQKGLNPLELIITQPRTGHPDSTQKSGYDHKTESVNSHSASH